MGAHDKRMIIDRLFGLEILGSIKWKVKYKIKTLKEYLDNIDTEISVLERSIQTSLKELDSLNEKLKTDGEEKKKDLTEKIKKYSKFISDAEDKLKEIVSKDRDVINAMKTLSEQLNENRSDEKTCSQKIHLYESGKCPTCETDLTSDHHKSVLQEFLEKRGVAQDMINELKEKIAKLYEKQGTLKKVHDELKSKKISAETHVSSWKTEINKLNEGQLDNAQTSSLDNIISDGKEKKTEAINKKSEEEKKANFLRIIEDIFGDKGVKLSALKRIVPLLNVEIRKVMTDLNMDYRVTFNEEFDVDIQHLGFKVVPEQLSTGERKKVDFAALIALIRLMKIRFSGVNLTFLDEIFSSIDTDGIHHILGVLHKTCRELNLNIFVINHSQLPTEIFDYRLEIQKNNGFSNLNIEKIS
jgi:DNA repair exonuclease SbcCD ATPase subunit